MEIRLKLQINESQTKEFKQSWRDEYIKMLSAFITYEGIQRVESFPISELAFREALINAVVHKIIVHKTAYK